MKEFRMSSANETMEYVLSMLLKEKDAVTAEYWASAANKLAGIIESESRIALNKQQERFTQLQIEAKKESE
jgi:uncharacterized Zn finger protein (UPF0148 family)